MKIEIDGRYVITGDQNQFILNEKKVVKEGKNAGQETLTVVGYYPKLSWLINSLIARDIRTDDIDSLQAIQERINEIAGSVKRPLRESQHDPRRPTRPSIRTGASAITGSHS